MADALGIPAHDTMLGTYGDELVVACRDFKVGVENLGEFADYLKERYNSKDRGKYLFYNQLYETIENSEDLSEYKKECICNYWDTMVVDALVGNFDRHTGNWGYLADDLNGTFRIAPMYDFGSTLFPRLSDFGRKEKMGSHFAMMERCFVFPSSQLYMSNEKNGAVSYYDLLCSGFDKNCSEAVLRIVPKIKIDRIRLIINSLEGLTDIQREFYCEILAYRIANILLPAYNYCKTGQYNEVNGNTEISVKQLDGWIKEKRVCVSRDEVMQIAESSNSLMDENLSAKPKKGR